MLLKAPFLDFSCVAISLGTGTPMFLGRAHCVGPSRGLCGACARLDSSNCLAQSVTVALHRFKLPPGGTECSPSQGGNAFPLSSCSVVVRCGGLWCVCLSSRTGGATVFAAQGASLRPWTPRSHRRVTSGRARVTFME